MKNEHDRMTGEQKKNEKEKEGMEELTARETLIDLIETLLLEDGERYDDFIRQWKRRALTQVGYLLLNTDDRTDVDRMVETTLGPATENLQPTT